MPPLHFSKSTHIAISVDPKPRNEWKEFSFVNDLLPLRTYLRHRIWAYPSPAITRITTLFYTATTVHTVLQHTQLHNSNHAITTLTKANPITKKPNSAVDKFLASTIANITMGLCQSSQRVGRSYSSSDSYRPSRARRSPPPRDRAPRPRGYSPNYDGGPPCPNPPCQGYGRCGHGRQRSYVQSGRNYAEEYPTPRRKKSVQFDPMVRVRYQ
jgi:hypothetical protein